MRVLGVDPGSKVCGFGVLEVNGEKLVHIESGALAPGASLPMQKRLQGIFEGLCGVIARTRPECMSIETVFYSKNAQSSLKLGQARGVALLAAAISDMPVHEYAPSEIKLALCGRGRANKAEVRKIVSLLVGIDDWATSDVSDAVAIAICHINLSETKDILGVSSLPMRRKRRRFRKDDIPA